MASLSNHSVQTSASEQGSSQIYTFPTLLDHPIDQRGRPGRRPKSIAMLRDARYRKWEKDTAVKTLQKEIQELELFLQSVSMDMADIRISLRARRVELHAAQQPQVKKPRLAWWRMPCPTK